MKKKQVLIGSMKDHTDWARVDALKNEDIDLSDIPLQHPEDWKDAVIVNFKITRKTPVTIRLDPDIIEWFKKRTQAGGFRGYQTYINAVLRAYMELSKRRKRA